MPRSVFGPDCAAIDGDARKPQLPDNSVALPFVMRVWMENQPMFAGSYQRKVTILALVALIQLNHAQLNAITVKARHPSCGCDAADGEPTQGPEIVQQGRQTRSKVALRCVVVTSDGDAGRAPSSTATSRCSRRCCRCWSAVLFRNLLLC